MVVITLYVDVSLYSVKINIQAIQTAASSHLKAKHAIVESANKRHRARRVSRTTANGALGGYRERGAEHGPNRARLRCGRSVTGTRGTAALLPSSCCPNIFLPMVFSSLLGVFRGGRGYFKLAASRSAVRASDRVVTDGRFFFFFSCFFLKN